MLEGRAIVHKTVTSTDVVIVTPASERGGHRVALAGPALLSWRSQPSGEWPTTSVGELNRIGEPKNPSVVHPPHSTVLRREKRKRDPYTADRQKHKSFQYNYFNH